MDLAFSEEQQMLRHQARSFLGQNFAANRLVEIADQDPWDSPTLARKELRWQKIAELGWIGLSVPESDGGAGYGFLEEAVLFEEMGYTLYPGPYLSTIGLALPALARERDVLSKVVSGEWAATFAFQASTGLTLFPDLRSVDVAVVASGVGDSTTIRSIETESLPDVSDLSTVDSTRRYGTFEVENDNAATLVAGREANQVLGTMRLRTGAALSLEAIGVAQFALDTIQAYVKQRKQFGKPIGSYQAVSHQVSNMYVDIELARSLAYWAAWTVAEDDRQAPVAVAAAKAAASEAAVLACERSIQLHGGTGFTWENILHRYYRRALWIASFGSSSMQCRASIAAALLS